MATFCNLCLPLELARMLMHVVHQSKHERYVECSPYGTHFDPDDVEAGMPLNNVYPAPVNNTHRMRTVPTGGFVGTTVEMSPVQVSQVVAPIQATQAHADMVDPDTGLLLTPRFDPNTGQPLAPVPQGAPKPAFDANPYL